MRQMLFGGPPFSDERHDPAVQRQLPSVAFIHLPNSNATQCSNCQIPTRNSQRILFPKTSFVSLRTSAGLAEVKVVWVLAFICHVFFVSAHPRSSGRLVEQCNVSFCLEHVSWIPLRVICSLAVLSLAVATAPGPSLVS